MTDTAQMKAEEAKTSDIKTSNMETQSALPQPPRRIWG